MTLAEQGQEKTSKSVREGWKKTRRVMADSTVGTADYMAPEVRRVAFNRPFTSDAPFRQVFEGRGYDKGADWWYCSHHHTTLLLHRTHHRASFAGVWGSSCSRCCVDMPLSAPIRPW